MSLQKDIQQSAQTSRYGPEDILGAVQEISTAKVVAAAGLVMRGRCYSLAQVLDVNSPRQMWRHWHQALIADRTGIGRAIGPNRLTFVEDIVSGALHSGTHLDGLGHVGIGEHTYNGLAYDDVISAEGLITLGIEHVPPIVTRGVLLDIAGLVGVACLEAEAVITAEQLEEAASRQNVRVEPGDALFIHTGWGSLWELDPKRYERSEPGIGLEAAEWCTSARVAVIAADNWAVEAAPGRDPALAFPVHQHCITRYGVHLLENARTEELAQDSVHEFLCAILPARLRGATASVVNPVAVV